MARIADGKIYETQEEHDRRIRWENHKFHADKKRSRSRTRNLRVRRICFQRADFKCEICAYGFDSILLLHHIMPVQLGGPASARNLIVLCPNCHALVHRYSHHLRSSERKYPAWIGGLKRAGLSEQQAKRLLLVASKEARLTPGGSIVHKKDPSPLVSIIVDENGKPVDPRHDPAMIEAALQHLETIFTPNANSAMEH